MTNPTEKREVVIYDAKTITRGLTALAAANGNARKASAALAEDDIQIPHDTLYYWKRNNHKEEYERIRAEQLPRLREQAADQHMALAQRSMEVEADLLDLLNEKRAELPARDLAGAVRNVAVGSAVHTEKAQLLNDQPTERRAIDLPGILQELKSLGVDPKHVLNMEEVQEAEVVEQSSSVAGGIAAGGPQDSAVPSVQTR